MSINRRMDKEVVVYIYMYVCVHIYMYTHTHTHTHTREYYSAIKGTNLNQL